MEVSLTSVLRRCLCLMLVFPVRLLACPPAWNHELYVNASDLTISTHEKRWHSIFNAENFGAKFWPNSKITFCFADDQAKTTLKRALADAWQLWRAAGIDSRLKFERGTDADCAPANRANVLVISYNNGRQLRTTVGMTPAVDGHSPGPSMTLDPDPTFGNLDTTANVAHEIGHAWGLFHEQQRLDMWATGPPYFGTGNNEFIFNCQNLKDYALWQGRLTPAELQRSCQSYTAAASRGFSAMEFLPMRNTDHPPNGEEFDWDSLMLYGSQVGGRGQGANRATVYMRANGQQIPFNLVPSQRDVANLNGMYPQTGPDPATCFLYEECYPRRSVFQKLKKACHIGPT